MAEKASACVSLSRRRGCPIVYSVVHWVLVAFTERVNWIRGLKFSHRLRVFSPAASSLTYVNVRGDLQVRIVFFNNCFGASPESANEHARYARPRETATRESSMPLPASGTCINTADSVRPGVGAVLHRVQRVVAGKRASRCMAAGVG
ncbi:hypothetical protein MRX96_043487 [Rhipicephalus microplus]